ncbi:MAG: hypothetical protein OEQ18_05895, partial [Gammaproteobacteria bacterium]|nr:hypothetical protein [Gammaproteobacteria bacterium]
AHYLFGVTLLVMLLSGDQLVQGFEAIGHTATRIPGPYYFLFEIFAVATSLGLIGLFCFGSFRQVTAQRRAQNALLLAGITPALCVVVGIVTLLHFGVKSVNAAIILPFAGTVFLVVCAYAIYQYRIFDIHLFIPWSKRRRRKTAFHDRIRSLIAEIADLQSVQEALQRISDTLGCPALILGLQRPVYAGNAATMAHLDAADLRAIDHIVVANEIADRDPHTYQRLKDHGVAAVVPFRPYNESVSGWLLLGDSFNEKVYSPPDFRLVEELFGKMSDLFLDKVVTLRAQLKSANRQIRTLRDSNEALARETDDLGRELAMLRRQVEAVGQPDRALLRASDAAHHTLGSSVILLGRDRPLLELLRGEFSEVTNYVGPGSAALRRAAPPEVFACRVGKYPGPLAKKLAQWRDTSAIVIYGARAQEFAKRHRDLLRSRLVDVVPEGVPRDTLVRHVRSVLELRKHCYWVGDNEHPLIGVSTAFTAYLRRLQMLAGFRETMYLHYDDRECAQESARYLHRESGTGGELVFVRSEALFRTLREQRQGDLVVCLDFEEIAPARQSDVLQKIRCATAFTCRLVLGFRDRGNQALAEALDAAPDFVVRQPKLHERRDDIPLLVHYTTLQFNFSSGTFVHLTHEEVKSLKLHEPADWTLDGLRNATIGFLVERAHAEAAGTEAIEDIDISTTERTLDELTTEFESRIIRATLKRCDGNKSKAARLLGIRPNTLHYKLRRYGIDEPE